MNLILAVESGMDAASQTLSDALAGGNVWLAVVAGLAILAVAVLKILGKDVPIVDPVIDIALGVAKKLLPSKTPPAPADPVKPEGVAAVVLVKKDEEK